MMIEQLRREPLEELAAIIHCESRAQAKRLCVWLNGLRPEFEDELEPGEESWLALMDLWPKTGELKNKGCEVFAHWWDERTPKVNGLVDLDTLAGIEVGAIYLKPAGAGEDEGEQYDGESDELGFYIVRHSDRFELIWQKDWSLPGGHTLQSENGTIEGDLKALLSV